MTDFNNEVRDLNIDELARVTGGEALTSTAIGVVQIPGGGTVDWGRRGGRFGDGHFGGGQK